MLFNSFHFLIFFPTVVALYFLFPAKWRNALLLAASAYFYMALIPKYILVLVYLVIIDYIAGILLERSSGRRKKVFLYASIVSNIGVLFIFKYFNFFIDNIATVADMLNLNYSAPVLYFILPVGLSFHTFQSLSYVIEVYRGNQRAERNFITYAVYVMFFPQLVAGPIERPGHLLPQFKVFHRFDWERIKSGLSLMLWGFFKKMVIADNAARVVNTVYADPHSFGGAHFIIATVLFSFQIYCDFSGYSDIAIGGARVIGFDLTTNFNRPYLSRSISEFWRRWHMTLMSWFRDYVYIPLGGSRVGSARALFNILIVFLISGLWHGAAWTFVVWGLLNAAYVILGKFTLNIRRRAMALSGLARGSKTSDFLSIFATFSLVTFSWIFFRAESIDDALYMVSNLLSGMGEFLSGVFAVETLRRTASPLGVSAPFVVMLTLSICALIYAEYKSGSSGVSEMIDAKSRKIRYSLYYALILALMFFAFQGDSPFIYFQF